MARGFRELPYVIFAIALVLLAFARMPSLEREEIITPVPRPLQPVAGECGLLGCVTKADVQPSGRAAAAEPADDTKSLAAAARPERRVAPADDCGLLGCRVTADAAPAVAGQFDNAIMLRTSGATTLSTGSEAAPRPHLRDVAARAASRLTNCSSGCAGRGSCNRELGRCDCPPFYKGDRCDEPLFPACVDQWGLRPEVAICGIQVQPAFPTTCACLQQCAQLGLDARQECVVEPEAGKSMAESAHAVKRAMPWMPMIANVSLAAMTAADAKRSKEQHLCSGHGIKSTQLPYEFYAWLPKDAPEKFLPACRCFPGWAGPNCEIEMDKHADRHKCVNDCNGRGACVHNWCRCEEGTWGVDCSITAEAIAAPPSELRPRIYIYDMPPRFTSWMSAYRRGDWTRDQ